ncbi:MAG: ArnT family glycosyltransferase [Thermodesulfobacteriota bacterium]
MLSIEDIYKAGFVLGALSIVLFFLGHLGLISPLYIAVSVLAAAVFFIAAVRRTGTIGPGPAVAAPPLSAQSLTLIAAAVVLVLVLLPLALTPPTIRDELIQHLAVPKLYLAKGRIYEIPFMGFSYLPQNIDLLYMIPLAFGSDIAPRLIHMAFAVLTGLLVYFFLLPGSGRAYALVGFFLYLGTPLVANLSRMAYIDHGSAFYSTLALFAALKWRSERFDFRWLVYAALSMGLALGSKYNAAISFLLIALFVLYAYSKDRKDPAGAIKAVLIFSAVAFAVFSPWLIRNYIWKGNPFYPLWESAMHAAAVGEGLHVTGEMAPMVKRFILYKEGTLDLILLPLRIFWEGADNSIARFDGVMNPIYLAFIPFAFLKRRRGDGDILFLALFSLLFLLFAAFTVDLVTRYLMPAVPLVVILVVLGFRNLLATRRLAGPAAVLMAALLVFDAAYLAGLYKRYAPLAYLTGSESREQYLERTLPDYSAVNFANRTLPKGAKVMLLFAGERGYYWERDVYYGDRNGVFLIRFVNGSPSGAALAKKFKGSGATHLFMHEALMEKFINDNFTGDSLQTVADFFNNHSERLFHANGFALYLLK